MFEVALNQFSLTNFACDYYCIQRIKFCFGTMFQHERVNRRQAQGMRYFVLLNQSTNFR